MRSFRSTPLFIESLTDLSVKVLHFDGDRKQSLIEGLKQVNQNLPGNVYIPFVNNSWRNYTVLNICENESKLFLTNTRAPFLICMEIYRPEEILVTSQTRYREMLTPSLRPNLVGEMPLTDRFVEGTLIDNVISPFLNRSTRVP